MPHRYVIFPLSLMIWFAQCRNAADQTAGNQAAHQLTEPVTSCCPEISVWCYLDIQLKLLLSGSKARNQAPGPHQALVRCTACCSSSVEVAATLHTTCPDQCMHIHADERIPTVMTHTFYACMQYVSPKTGCCFVALQGQGKGPGGDFLLLSRKATDVVEGKNGQGSGAGGATLGTNVPRMSTEDALLGGVEDLYSSGRPSRAMQLFLCMGDEEEGGTRHSRSVTAPAEYGGVRRVMGSRSRMMPAWLTACGFTSPYPEEWTRDAHTSESTLECIRFLVSFCR